MSRLPDENLASQIDQAMLSDRHRLRRLLQPRRGAPNDRDIAKARSLLETSVQRVEERRKAHPALGNASRLAFDDALPICERIDEIAAAIEKHSVVVVAGETGSGKSTQIPKICLKLGRGLHGMIGHTQPRRIAARSVASRVAEELGTPVGEGVGFKMRFADAVSPRTHVKVMTDGILLAEIQSDRFLEAYDTLIIDEAHERSLNIDLILGYLHRLVRKRSDLRVIITSATIDAARFAAYFDAPEGIVSEEFTSSGEIAAADAMSPVIEVSGRTYPVETRYRRLERDGDGELDESAAIADAAEELLIEGRGDILVFLPTEREIREAAEVLRGRFRSSGRGALSDIEILPLYGRLSERDQHRVFESHAQARIVLATNVAESSLTVPGIRYVIDTGTARISRFTPQSKVQRLPIEEISRASADQRKGRCGRTGPGICVRLYSEQDYLEREPYTPPEILRTNLAAGALQTLASGLGQLGELPLLDRPQPGAVRAAYGTLLEIGAIREAADGYQLTERGRLLVRLPVDPRIARMITAGHDEHCLAEVLIIAAALEVRDPRDRPIEKQQAADEAHRQFVVEGSDFLTLLELWDTYQEWSDKLSNSQLRKACQKAFLSHARMREWRDLHRQLGRLVASAGMKPEPRTGDADAVHRALLAGLLSNIALRNDSGEYVGAGDQALVLWPGSAAVAKKPKWLLAAELVETTRRFARVVGPINPDWVERLAGDLVKRSCSDPQWERTAGSAMAWERVTLYGLPIVPRRRCRLSQYDPVKARELFIQHALVEGDYETRAPYHAHNLALKEELHGWQAKLRKTQLFASEEQQFAFFDERLPADVVDSRTFEKWRKSVEVENPRLLCLSKEDLLVDPDAAVSPEAFPDQVQVGGVTAQVEYRLEPGSEEDGLTLVIPADAVGRVSPAQLGWLIPGLLEEKVESLIKSLPKELRRLFVPINETARAVIPRLRYGEGDLVPQIAEILRTLSGEYVPVEAFDAARVPGHLRFRVRAVDAAGKAVGETADLNTIQQQLKGKTAAAFQSLAKSDDRWNCEGLTDWTFGELPEMVELTRGAAAVIAHPMLVDRTTSVSLQLSDDPTVAERETRRGLVRLLALAAARKIEQQVAWLPKLDTWLAQGGSILAAVEAQNLGEAGEKKSAKAHAGDFRRQIAARIAEGASDCPLPLPRSENEYRRWLKTAESRIGVASQDVMDLLEPVVSRGREIQKAAFGISQSALGDSQRDAVSQWTTLFGDEFLAKASWSGLQHYPRYLEAMQVRWKKLTAGGLVKDRELMAQIAPFWNRYCEIVRKRPEVRPAFEPVRWLLEEYRVSLFAQQLRTAVPVSEKRIRDAWGAAIAAATGSSS